MTTYERSYSTGYAVHEDLRKSIGLVPIMRFIRDADQNEDTKKHIDMFLKIHEWYATNSVPKGIVVPKKSADGKARKALIRGLTPPQDEWFVLELRNKHGNNGWLYGEADYIAQAIKEKFLFYDRKEAVELIERIMEEHGISIRDEPIRDNKKTKVELYTLYGREGDQDKIIWVTQKEILPLVRYTIDKASYLNG